LYTGAADNKILGANEILGLAVGAVASVGDELLGSVVGMFEGSNEIVGEFVGYLVGLLDGVAVLGNEVGIFDGLKLVGTTVGTAALT